jgi:ribosomal 50S subunit-recycling heat shock protein
LGIEWLQESGSVKGRHVKELLTAGRVTENGAHRQSDMEPDIVDTLRCCFQNNKGKTGDWELSIIASVKRYFEELRPPIL